MANAVLRPGRLERTAVIAEVQQGAHAEMLSSRLPGESAATIQGLVETIESKVEDDQVTPALVNGLARTAIMCRLTSEELLAYAQEHWQPSYEVGSYLD